MAQECRPLYDGAQAKKGQRTVKNEKRLKKTRTPLYMRFPIGGKKGGGGRPPARVQFTSLRSLRRGVVVVSRFEKEDLPT